MRLVDNWRAVLLRAWSVRFMALAFLVLLLGEMAPALGDWLPGLDPRAASLLAAVLTVLGILARPVLQKSVSGGDDAE